MGQTVENAARSLAATRELLDAVLANLRDGVMVFGPDGGRLWANDRAAQLTGYATAAALLAAPADEARNRFRIFDANGTPFPLERLPHRRALAGEEPTPVLVRFREGDDGPERASEVTAVPVRDAGGAVLFAISFFREVTQDVEAARTTAMLDALYSSAPVGLGFWDRDLRYLRVNEALAAINERSPKEHVGKSFAEVIPQLAHIIEPIARRVLETGEPVIALDMTGGTPGDPTRVRYWRASYYPVTGTDGAIYGVGAVVEETTERRRAEQRTELQHAVSRILTEAETSDEALPLLLDTLCGPLGWDVACYWSVDPDEPRVTRVRPGVHAEGFIAMTERASLSPAMLPGRVAASGRAEWLETLQPDRFARASVASAEGLVSGVAFPVLVGSEVVGVLEMFSQIRQPYDAALETSLASVGGQIGQFLRRKRVEEDRKQLLVRERQARADAEGAAATLRKLARVSEAALEHHSLHDLLNTLLDRIVEVLEADTAAILLLEEDGRLHVRAAHGLDEELERAIAIPVGVGMAGRVAASRRPLLVHDLSEIELFSPVLRERGINSLVAIPLIVEDTVIGVLHTGSEAYAQFTDEDARLLELIADRIALAINQTTLLEAERAAQDRLHFLGEASTVLASSLDVEATLNRVARLAVPHFADWCVVDLVRPDGRIRRVAVAHADPGRAEVSRRIAELFPATLADEYGIGKVVRERTPMLGERLAPDDVRADFPDDPAYAELILELGVRSAVTAPLVARDVAFGAVTFVWADSGRAYGAADLQFAQEIAARAAVAVDNARLYAAAERRRDRLGLLAEASALLGATLDVDRALEELSALLAERFADWIAIHLVHTDGRARLTAVGHDDPDRLRRARADMARIPPDRELPTNVSGVLESGQSILWNGDGVPEGSFEHEEGLHSGLVVPLVARGRTLGTLSLVRGATDERYEQDDLEFAEDVARRAAIALDNVQLYREAALSRDRLGFLAEASSLLGASLDVDSTLEQLSALVAGRVADWCTVHLASDLGPARLVSTAHWQPGRVPSEDVPSVVEEVIRTGRPELLPALPAGPDGIHSRMVVPLQARGRTFGAMSLAWAETDATYDERDLEFATDLARRAGVAIDNAQLYRAAEERAQAARVLASVGDGVFLVDRGGVVRTWNRAAAAATGLRATDVVDRPVTDVLPGWAAVAARIPIVAAGSSASRAESLPLGLGDRELWLSLHGVTVPDGIVYAFRDLTEERALETMRTEFVSTVSHELRTPLAAIYGAAMTLRRSDVVLDDGQRANLLDVVSGEADRLARTVNDILWASRLDTDSLHVTIQNCDPVQLVREVADAQRAHLDRGHEIVLHVDDGLPLVAGDPDKVGRVLINLVDNGVKYSPDGGRVEVVVKQAGSHVRFSVTDSGLGIPPAEQRRIFEKFYRLDPNMNRGVGGTGLGLYICRELVRRMDGRIWVDSAGVGRGSTFHVELPAASDF